ncbi:31-O-demethyl-FK506 methyltransferase FkbM [Rosistilla ulvae]|uniref:31-O-demethyl-FK506 methyltransferase FkbM n=1 Tax=Rosistilla ulvae TaxID=1930277 RepID=A0A517M205_9BACT|nr:FkbM family methyltransferase [Rosistilla ulvae]QDS88914.1 31-O-demethyl-FK506 methyltransferase FkbM [Rosistilla ulvae]
MFSELRRGDIAIDLGANVGKITQLMANTGAKVHAFEPDPNAFRVLEKKFRWNWNVRLHNVAVSNKVERMKLFFREEHLTDPVKYSVGSTLNPNKTNNNNAFYAEVDVIRFSDFLRRFSRIRVLKIDIEGAEVHVLEDLLNRDLLRRVDITLVETHEECIPDTSQGMAVIRQRVKDAGLSNIYFNWI